MRNLGGCICGAYMRPKNVCKCGKYATFSAAIMVAIAYANIPYNEAEICLHVWKILHVWKKYAYLAMKCITVKWLHTRNLADNLRICDRFIFAYASDSHMQPFYSRICGCFSHKCWCFANMRPFFEYTFSSYMRDQAGFFCKFVNMRI